MVRKNWAYTHNFKELIILISDWRKQLQKHSIFSSFTFSNDEILDVTSIEHMAVCAMFDHHSSISEYFIGFYSFIKVVGTSPSVNNIMCSFEKYFTDVSVNLSKAGLAFMNTTSLSFR